LGKVLAFDKGLKKHQLWLGEDNRKNEKLGTN
jgi:hypothetical protein